MERLTKISEVGNAYYPKCFEEPCCGMGECLDDNCSLMLDACKKLAAYEDSEEQGLLVRLPDDLNRVLYKINYRWTECTEYGEQNNKCEIYDCKCECDSRKEYYIAEVGLQYITIKGYYNCLGEFVFLTREEAEKKLEEIQNDKI